tara:strand:+ start:1891 stop:3669 length:1779 start_codon:yes stop_codon:yes gene_type:complete
MAYKFQTGTALMSGTLEQSNKVTIDQGGLTVTAGGVTVTAGTAALQAATCTTLSATGDVDLGNATSDTVTVTGRFDSDLVPSADSAQDLGTAGLQWADAHIDVGYIDQLGAALDANSQAITNVDINSGNIDNTVIGATTAVAGTFAAVAGTTGTYSGILKTDDTTDATNKTNGSLQTDGGLSVAKKIYSGTDVVLAADSGTVTMGAATALVVSAAGAIAVNNADDSTAATNGSLQTDGGLGVVKDIIAGNDVTLKSDDAVLAFGDGADVSLTHVADTALQLNSTRQLRFNDWSANISSSAANYLDLFANTQINLSGAVNVASSTLTVNGAIVAETGLVPDAHDSSYIGTQAKGFSDLYLADGAVISMGGASETDVTFTHVADTGVLLNSTNRIQFNGASQYIGASSAADLDLAATTDINLDCTTVDINGACDISNNLTVAGVTSLQGNIDLGNATSDTITPLARFDGDLVPNADSSIDLGTTALRYSTLYVDSIVGANMAFDVETVAGGGTIAAGTDFALINTGSGVTVTMPAASAGHVVRVKLSSSIGDVILKAAAGDVIEGSAAAGSIRLESTGSAVTCVAYDAGTWFVI